MESAPRPERDPEFDKEASPAPQGGGGPGDGGRRGGEAYIDKPDFKSPRGKGWWLALAAAGLGAAITISGLVRQSQPPPPSSTPVVTAPAELPTLLVGTADRDDAATADAQKIIASGGTTKSIAEPSVPASGVAEKDSAAALDAARSGSAAPAAAPAPVPAKTPNLVPAAPSVLGTKDARLSQLQQELAAAPDSVRQSIRSGEMQMFTFRFVDWADEDGDVVAISVDGNPLGTVMIGHSGQALTIPLKPGKTHVLTITGVRDGGGGITFGLQSSVGRVDARALSEGQSASWQIGFEK